MRRTPSNIRITKNDKQEYARLVRNTKAKIRRANENYGIDLSGEIKIPSIDDFQTRSEFNEWKNKQKSFTSVSNRNYQFKKNEFGVVASKVELDEVMRDTKKAQRIADKLIKELEKKPEVEQRMKQMAKPQNMTGISKPKDFDFSTIRSRTQFLKKMKNMKERANEEFFDKRMEQLKENFINLLESTFNTDVDALVKKLRQMPVDDFYELYLYLSTEADIDFSFFYTTEADGSETNNAISEIESYVDRYYSGNLNMDMKGF